jgi:poly-gamma-glutamate synthesis protein (capsule biosynthesis protein)
MAAKVWLWATVVLVAGGAGLARGAAPLAGRQAITITLVGQSVIRSDVRIDAPEWVPVIKSLLKGDAAFTNFEGAVYDSTKGQSYRSGQFVSPPATLEALKSFGFSLVSLANNHAFDLKAAGIENTLATAKRLGLTYAGIGRDLPEAGAPRYLRTPNGTIALVALASGLIGAGRATESRSGVNELRFDGTTPKAEDFKRILRYVREARRHADIVIVSQHNHYYPGIPNATAYTQMVESELPARLTPPDWMHSWAHRLVDAGADMLAFHGPPFMHGVEIYKGRPIFYSLGNFIFEVPPGHLEEPIMWESVVAYVEFVGSQLRAVRFQPIAMNKIGKGLPDPHDQSDMNQYFRTRGLPRPVSGDQAKFLLQRLANLSRPFGTRIEINGTTAAVRLP